MDEEVRRFPLYTAVLVDLYLASRYAKVIFTEGCGKNGSSVAVRVKQKSLSLSPS